jgi:hypothetical protein
MTAFRHVATGEVHIAADASGYEGPDWEALPDPPAGYGPWLWLDGEWTLDDAPAWARLRAERAERLRACDWTQLPDVPEATRLAWQPYRQALRDLPDTTTDPFAPDWPTPPA